MDQRYDPYDQGIREDPYGYFAQLRATCPVNHHVLSHQHRDDHLEYRARRAPDRECVGEGGTAWSDRSRRVG